MASLSASQNLPTADVPDELRRVWLHFHRTRLCKGVDTVFVFHGKGVEVWCLVEDEGDYEKLQEMLAPLESSHRIELYTTWPSEDQKDKPKNPPPSLWNNRELRYYLRDPFVSGWADLDLRVRLDDRVGSHFGFLLKQRLYMFAEETLEWRRVMRRYATELPDLTWAAFDDDAPEDTKSLAAAVCLDHAEELEKYTEKTIDNLQRALPSADEPDEEFPRHIRARKETVSLYRMAVQLSGVTQSVAQGVYRFFYPKTHSVELGDLREPRLLDSLKNLRTLSSEYCRAVEAARRVRD